MSGRLPYLDCLRCLAVLLVLSYHVPGGPLFVGGWVGVDLFFVLSGFLVSGLLFREHRKTASLKVARFLVRRGLKIYPAFYLCLAISACVLLFQGALWKRALLTEALFVQNYTAALGSGRIWGQNWSLAVEEHFYILLPLLLIALLWANRTKRDPFAAIPYVYIAVAILCVALRLANLGRTFNVDTHHFPTHLRIDSLLCGVALSYLFHYREGTVSVAKRFRQPIAILGLAMLSPVCFIPLEHPFTWTIGYLLYALGSACLVAWAATASRSNRLANVVASLGAYSYSIYLWHMAVLVWFIEPYIRGPLLVPVFVIASFAAGIAMSLAVEWPVIHLRDRWFPSRS